MTTNRIKEIQDETAYPNSTSVQQALLKVWNECEQEQKQVNNCSIPDVGLSLPDEDEINSMRLENDYPNGLDMEQFERVEAISFYNHNYYKGVKNGDILHGKSDDDNTTEWYLIRNQSMIYLGESYCSENEKLNRYE